MCQLTVFKLPLVLAASVTSQCILLFLCLFLPDECKRSPDRFTYNYTSMKSWLSLSPPEMLPLKIKIQGDWPQMQDQVFTEGSRVRRRFDCKMRDF